MCLFNREGGHSWTKTRLTFFSFPITDRSEKSPIPAKRIQNIIEFLTYEVFKYSCRGLFENHKFLFTLLLALKIDIQGGKVKVLEFQTLIKGKRVEEQMKEEVRDKRARQNYGSCIAKCQMLTFSLLLYYYYYYYYYYNTLY